MTESEAHKDEVRNRVLSQRIKRLIQTGQYIPLKQENLEPVLKAKPLILLKESNQPKGLKIFFEFFFEIFFRNFFFWNFFSKFLPIFSHEKKIRRWSRFGRFWRNVLFDRTKRKIRTRISFIKGGFEGKTREK